METLTPLGKVFHAGTLSGNPIATAAGLAALDLLDGDLYIELMARARHFAALLRDACAAGGFPAQFPVVGTLVGMVCGDVERPTNFDGAKQTDEAAFARFFHAMLDEGVAMAPGAYEAIFVGAAHTDQIIEADRRSRPSSCGDRRERLTVGRVPDAHEPEPVASTSPCGRSSACASLPRSAAWSGCSSC